MSNESDSRPKTGKETSSPRLAGGHIVKGGGRVEGETHHGRPKLRLFAIASVIWVFPSFGAIWIVGPDVTHWFRAESFLEGLQAIAFEQWIALFILLAHPVFACLAWHYYRTEPLKEEKGWEPDSDDGLHKLR